MKYVPFCRECARRDLPVAMRITEYDFTLQSSAVAPPDGDNWELIWHGFYHLKESKAQSVRALEAARESAQFHTAFDLEKFAFMSILAEIGPAHVNFFELGCGRAPWCLALAGAIKYHFVPRPPHSYRVLAVEAEPTHFIWAKDHLGRQKIDGEVVHGAVTSYVGSCWFMANTDPAAHMGQAIHQDGNIEVPAVTIDSLRVTYAFDHIHVLHMDIQGQELEALVGAEQTLRHGLLDYIIIGTHGVALEAELKKILAPTHQLVVELPTLGETRVDGIRKPFKSFDDGVLVFKKKHHSKQLKSSSC